jgi:hypothetical protein
MARLRIYQRFHDITLPAKIRELVYYIALFSTFQGFFEIFQDFFKRMKAVPVENTKDSNI